MSAGILRLVNSSFFGLIKEENDPVRATVLLGEKIVKGLVLHISFFSVFKEKLRYENFSIDNLSEHSLKVAEYSRKMIIYEGFEKSISEKAFTAGLLHDIGILILVMMEKKYSQIYPHGDTNDIDLFSEEYKLFRVSHAEIGAYLLDLWGISSEIVQTIAFHHKPEKILNKELFNIVSAVHTADMIDNFNLTHYSNKRDKKNEK